MDRCTSGEEKEEMSAQEFDQLSPNEKMLALLMMAFVLGGKDLMDRYTAFCTLERMKEAATEEQREALVVAQRDMLCWIARKETVDAEN